MDSARAARSWRWCPRWAGCKSLEECKIIAIPASHRPAESVRLLQPYSLVAGSRSLWSAASDNGSNPPIPSWEESLRAEERWHMQGVV